MGFKESFDCKAENCKICLVATWSASLSWLAPNQSPALPLLLDRYYTTSRPLAAWARGPLRHARVLLLVFGGRGGGGGGGVRGRVLVRTAGRIQTRRRQAVFAYAAPSRPAAGRAAAARRHSPRRSAPTCTSSTTSRRRPTSSPPHPPTPHPAPFSRSRTGGTCTSACALSGSSSSRRTAPGNRA
jgi:hypothetical protein